MKKTNIENCLKCSVLLHDNEQLFCPKCLLEEFNNFNSSPSDYLFTGPEGGVVSFEPAGSQEIEFTPDTGEAESGQTSPDSQALYDVIQLSDALNRVYDSKDALEHRGLLLGLLRTLLSKYHTKFGEGHTMLSQISSMYKPNNDQ